MGTTSKTQSVGRGQSIRTDYARDDSSHSLKETMGGKLGGSATYLGHSLDGVSAEVDGTAQIEKKNRFS